MKSKLKSILINIGFLLSIPVVIGAFVFAVSKDKIEQVKGFEVEILNPQFGFVNQKNIEQTLADENVILNYSTIEKLDVTSLENRINSNPWIDHAEVYITSAQNLKVKLKQVEPLLRVQRTDSTANGYYLDAKGFMIPLSRNYYPDLPILTAERPITTIGQRKELVNLAQYIERDTFWRATISQINLDKNNDVELVSLIGDANIRFGAVDNIENKFFRLFQFYKKGINRINWSNVKELDVRFDKQIVCRRYHKENHIEELSAPKLYKKEKTKPSQIALAEIVTVKSKNTQTEHPQNDKAKEPIVAPVSKNEEAQKIVKKTSKTKISNSELEVKEPAKKNTPKAKVAKKVKEQIKPKASPAINKTEPVKPKAVPTVKPKKKKSNIIINTEPVTSKKATQE